jgi:thiol-disulfide isomerase/thioredoxin
VSKRRLSAATVLAVAGVLLGSGAVGFLLHRLTIGTVPTLAPAPRAAPGPSLPAGPAGPQASGDSGSLPRRAIPEQLPDFSLPGTDGIPHRLSEWRGRPLVVNFWATWCEPCRREIPLLKAIRHENARNRLEIVGIAVDYRNPVEKYARAFGIDYPLLVGDKGGLAAASAFGMDTVLPFTVFADTQGRIVTLKIGELHRDEADFILARLTELDSGRLSLADARQQIGQEIGRLAASRAAPADMGGK